MEGVFSCTKNAIQIGQTSDWLTCLILHVSHKPLTMRWNRDQVAVVLQVAPIMGMGEPPTGCLIHMAWLIPEDTRCPYWPTHVNPELLLDTCSRGSLRRLNMGWWAQQFTSYHPSWLANIQKTHPGCVRSDRKNRFSCVFYMCQPIHISYKSVFNICLLGIHIHFRGQQKWWLRKTWLHNFPADFNSKLPIFNQELLNWVCEGNQ